MLTDPLKRCCPEPKGLGSVGILRIVKQLLITFLIFSLFDFLGVKMVPVYDHGKDFPDIWPNNASYVVLKYNIF